MLWAVSEVAAASLLSLLAELELVGFVSKGFSGLFCGKKTSVFPLPPLQVISLTHLAGLLVFWGLIGGRGRGRRWGKKV
jgi:hypothetical protein